MRKLMLIPAAALALAACNKADQTKTDSANGAGAPAAATPAAGPAAMPTLKSGLWTETATHDGKALATGQMRMCIDAATSAAMMSLSQKVRKSNCQQRTVSHGLDGSISVESVCPTAMGGTMTSKTVITGDFNAKYHMRSENSTTGASIPQMNGQHVMEIDAIYGGPCPADMVPGDVAMANGMKMNMNAIGAASSAPPGGSAGGGAGN